ncbi:hypothetical protein [Bacteroides xylanisolvens]|uniref:hypothetical protein n=2 Tax=Bacteroides TaxID=816 RepID=UPI00319E376A
MNRNIMVLNTNKITSHQIFINKEVPMKRECGQDRLFSFGECFDERMMNDYIVVAQILVSANHRIIVFHSHQKP